MIHIGSIPRCGSAYLVRSILGEPQGSRGPDTRGKGIYKTHRIPPEPHRPFGEGDSAIFLFGDVVESVVSTVRQRFEPGHFEHCGAEWDPDVDLLASDYLGYERIWDGWTGAPFPVLCVRYRMLGTGQGRQVIERWIGRSVPWLPWRRRSTSVTEAKRRRIQEAYAGLASKVEAAGDVFVAGSRPLVPVR